MVNHAGLVLATVFAVGGITACTSATAPPSPTGAQSAKVTAPPQPSISSQSLVSAPTPSPSDTPFLALAGLSCTAGQLEVRVGEIEGAAGNGIAYLIFTDRGRTPCTLRGTPGVQLLDARGRLLTMPPVRDVSTGYIPTYANRGVELLPSANEGVSPGPDPEGGIRGQAALPLQYGQDGCDNAVAAVRVQVSGGTFTVPITIPQPGAQGCELTRMSVNPFQPAEFKP